MSAAAAVINK